MTDVSGHPSHPSRSIRERRSSAGGPGPAIRVPCRRRGPRRAHDLGARRLRHPPRSPWSCSSARTARARPPSCTSCSGLLPLSHGSVEVLGDQPRRGDPRIGYVPQNYTATIGNAVRARDLVALGLTGGRWGLGRLEPRRARAGRAAPSRRWARSTSPTAACPPSPAASSSAWPSPRPWSPGPSCCCSTSRWPTSTCATRTRSSTCSRPRRADGDMTVLVVAHDLNPLLSVLTGAVYLLDGHPHYDDHRRGRRRAPPHPPLRHPHQGRAHRPGRHVHQEPTVTHGSLLAEIGYQTTGSTSLAPTSCAPR